MRSFRFLAVLPVFALAACADDAGRAVAPASVAAGRAPQAEVNALLARTRAATARFHDVEVALAEGYINTGECAAIPGVGAMGVHFVSPRLAGLTIQDGRVHSLDTSLDATAPEILLYEPQADGRLKLVGVEYWTSKAAWDATGATSAPSLFGRAFDYMADDPNTPMDEAHGFTPHYDLHVWVWQPNPSGMFAPWNPSVSCAAMAPAATAHAGH